MASGSAGHANRQRQAHVARVACSDQMLETMKIRGIWKSCLVAVRELRASTRSRRLHTFRLLIIALAGLTCLSLASEWPTGHVQRLPSYGHRLFESLSSIQVWIAAGYSVFYGMSSALRERRVATLEILLLTPISSATLVFGKILASAAASLALVLSLVPIELFAFLLGGVSGTDLIIGALMILEAALLGSAIGTMAGFTGSGAIGALTRVGGVAFSYLMISGPAGVWFYQAALTGVLLLPIVGVPGVLGNQFREHLAIHLISFVGQFAIFLLVTSLLTRRTGRREKSRSGIAKKRGILEALRKIPKRTHGRELPWAIAISFLLPGFSITIVWFAFGRSDTDLFLVWFFLAKFLLPLATVFTGCIRQARARERGILPLLFISPTTTGRLFLRLSSPALLLPIIAAGLILLLREFLKTSSPAETVSAGFLFPPMLAFSGLSLLAASTADTVAKALGRSAILAGLVTLAPSFFSETLDLPIAWLSPLSIFDHHYAFASAIASFVIFGGSLLVAYMSFSRQRAGVGA